MQPTIRYLFTLKLLLGGLLGLNPAAFATTLVYVSNTDDGQIAVYELQKLDGKLRPIQKINVGKSVMALTTNPERTRLYASLRAEPFSIATLNIDSKSGRLTPLAITKLPANTCHLATDHEGHFIFASSYSDSKVSIHKLGKNGVVEETPSQLLNTGKNAHAVVMTANKRAFVTNLGSDQVQQYIFDDKAGKLHPNTPSLMKTKTGAGPRHLAYVPQKEIMYLINELDGTLNTYTIDPKQGILSEIQSVSFLPKKFSGKVWGSQLAVTPDARLLFTAERTSSMITTFAIDPETNHAKALHHTPTEKQPRAIALSPEGHFLLVAGQRSHQLSVYKISAEGQLSPAGRYPVGHNPSWVEVISLPKS
ncbi:MAG: beta-propeller fold lactonase family protein [Myxococcales bacterium]|nr:beta-propeller fold lactonase family protein [Myxococcales bacterium]